MFRSLKFQSKNYDKVGVASDFHCFHKKPFIFEPRGFKSWEENHDFIIKNINDNFTENSLLFYLGDLTLNSNVEETEDFLSKLNPQIMYIFGNHESNTWKILKNYWLLNGNEENIESYPTKINKVTFCGMRLMASIDNQLTHFSHMAPAIWEHQNHLAVACFGHSHSTYKEALPEYPTQKRLDCSVDVSLKYNGNCFFDWKEILDIMSTKSYKIIDGHTPETN